MKKNKSLKICPLASGSKGNCVFVSTPETAVLVDAGLSGVEIEKRLALVGQTPEALSGIIITHEHTDHVRGAGILSRRFNIPVYLTPQTHGACKHLGKVPKLKFFECGTSFFINELQIAPFSISHDARDPAGLTLSFGEKKIGIATDLGHVTALVKEHLKNCHALYIESNHDPEMLKNGSYPWFLKQRVKSRTGHLSNMDTRALLAEILDSNPDQCLDPAWKPNLAHVILAHLSEDNNCPKKAACEVAKGINGSGVCLHVAGPDRPGEMIHL